MSRANRSMPDAAVIPVLAYADVNEAARIVRRPTDYQYGERQYTAEDPGGHRWMFSETIADSDPADWGGALVD